MPLDDASLLDATIAHLEHLFVSFRDEPCAASTAREMTRCKEASLTIGVLLPKLREVRDLRAQYDARSQGRCSSCED